jgi:SWI/SNF-related matrix-associated actin-dependent regulator 1 of chromatin subfamily A
LIEVLAKPAGVSLMGGQESSIRAILHVLQHGAVHGTGTARGALLADEQGTGKTPCAIVTANTLGYQRILVIAPQSLRQNWENEIRRWQTLNHPLYHLSAKNRGIYSPTFLSNLSCGWVIVNYDILHAYPGIKDAAWDLVICDEAIALKSHRARRTTAVFGGVYKRKRLQPIPAKKYLMLSGTPMPNRIEEISTLIEVLDPNNWSFKRLIKEYYDNIKFIDEKRRVSGGNPRDLHILQNRLRETIMVRNLKDDVLKLPPKVYQHHRIPLTSPQLLEFFARKHKVRNILLKELHKKGISKITRRKLTLQLNELQEYMAHTSSACSFKIDAVVEYLLRSQEKVVVFAYHRDLIEHYVERLRQAGRGVVSLTGDNSKNTKQIVDHFWNDPSIQFFVGNMLVAGQGLNLQVAAHVVIAELHWSPAIMEQCEDRCHRIGQERPVKVVYFILEGTLEEIMVAALDRKVATTRTALNPQKPQLATTGGQGC